MKTIIKRSTLFVVILFICAAILPLNASLKQEESSDIYTTLQERSELSTFTKIVQTAQYESTFQSEGEYTVFAPTNSAFESLDPSYLDQLLSDPVAAQEFLSSYFVQGTVSQNQVTAEVVGSAQVIEGDIAASNGVIHVLDSTIEKSSEGETEMEEEEEY